MIVTWRMNSARPKPLVVRRLLVISDVAQFLTHTLPVGRITATNWSAGIRGVGSLDACVGGAFWSVFSCLEALHCDRLLITCIQGFAGREECSLYSVSAARSSSPQSMVEMSRAPHVGCSRQLKAVPAAEQLKLLFLAVALGLTLRWRS